MTQYTVSPRATTPTSSGSSGSSGTDPAGPTHPATPASGGRDPRHAKRMLLKVGAVLGLLLGACFAGLPILWMVSSSFKANSEIFAYPPKLITENFSFAAYTSVFTDPTKLRFFFNSYFIASVVTVLTLVVAILAAYAFSRFQFRGKTLINIVIIGIQAVPPITLLIPYFGLIVALRSTTATRV
ncbi:hypothetical protein [Terracoccus luteus]|uniref:hypothetical protein n=1 Tax=Terracoccus luteus TaxID=53356 RepID=UPI001FEA1D60|nr:hypothetical protein [Terracoccus luteus]